MTIAQGVFKQVRYKRQTAFGLANIPDATAGQQLRRVSSSLDLTKNTYRSNEIRPDMQRYDFRHGIRSVQGSINGELSVGTYKDFFESFCRQLYQTAATTGSITAAVAATGFTRAAGSFVTDGFKVGDVVRATGYGTSTYNSRNLMVTAVTATDLDGFFIDGTALGVLAGAAGVTIAVQGKKTWIPESGHVNHLYAIEHYFSDLDETELFDSCRMGSMNLNLPATGFATIEMAFMGRDMQGLSSGSAPYFTSPSAVSTGTGLVAVNGALVVNGTRVATLTGMTIQGNQNLSPAEVVGSNTPAEIFVGSVDVSGQVTAYFDSITMRDMFVNETEATIVAAFVADNTGTAGFVSFVLPRVKFGGASKDDGEKGLTLTLPYTALKHAGTTTVLPTTISIQDSSVT